MGTEVEVLAKRIEALERDLRRAITIANDAVLGAQECADKAYQRGFREGFDRAFEAAAAESELHADHPVELSSEVAPAPVAQVDAGQPAATIPRAGLLGWLRRRRSAHG